VPSLTIAFALAVTGAVMADGAPANPGAVPPNASRVTGVVRGVAPAQQAQRTAPVSAHADQARTSVTIELETSAPEGADKQSLAVPGQVIEALSRESVPSDVVGHRIEGSLRLTGDTRGVRWWISSVRKLP
jgi:hypothetical protein